MNVHKSVLLALTSAALFVAAPISAQDFSKPGVNAKSEKPVVTEPGNEVKPKPIDPAPVGTKPAPVDPSPAGVKPAPVDPSPGGVKPAPVEPRAAGAPVTEVDPDPEVREEPASVEPKAEPFYALHIHATPDLFSIRGGMPGVPVALIVGIEETRYMLPYNALLRVQPMTIVVVGEFDDSGEFDWYMSDYKGAPVAPPLDVLVQALSVADEWFKLCTSELVRIRTDLVSSWHFDFLG